MPKSATQVQPVIFEEIIVETVQKKEKKFELFGRAIDH